jgi:hypothetical protein
MAPDGDGYSRRYSLIKGWDRCYVETTGYIVPTLLDVGRVFGEKRYEESAFRAAEWLLKVQTAEGAFTDIDNIAHRCSTPARCCWDLTGCFAKLAMSGIS